MAEKEQIRLLVAEDDPAVLQTISSILRSSGYDITTATDGFEALLHFQDRVPDLLLSDLNMPAMSGFELLSVIRRRFPQVVAVATTGAYSSGSVPPGVIADAFYAKGRKMPANCWRSSQRLSSKGQSGTTTKPPQCGFRETEKITTVYHSWYSPVRNVCGRSHSPSNTNRVRRY